jgi:hypothetical protein
VSYPSPSKSPANGTSPGSDVGHALGVGVAQIDEPIRT